MRRIKKIIELFLGISFIYGYFCTEKRISKLVSNMEKTIILSAIVGILPQVSMAQSIETTAIDVVVLNKNYPLVINGAVYNLTFYGSGVYDICRYDAEGNSYIGRITDC